MTTILIFSAIFLIAVLCALMAHRIIKRNAAESERQLQAELLSQQLALQKKKEKPTVESGESTALINVAKDGRDLGEFPRDIVKQMLGNGMLSPSDYFLDPATNTWVVLENHPGLR